MSKLTLFLLSACISLTDNTIKNKIETLPNDYESKEILNGNVTIVKHHNKGFACNYFDDKPELVKNVSVFVLGAMAVKSVKDMFSKDADSVENIANALILGGAISNTIDRVYKKYVVDYFKIKKTGIIYNLSDFSIFLGAVLTICSVLFSSLHMSNSTESSKK